MWFHKWIKQAKEFNQMPRQKNLGASSKIQRQVEDLGVGKIVCSHQIMNERDDGEWLCEECDTVVYGCKHPDGFTKINDTDYECLDCGLVNEEM